MKTKKKYPNNLRRCRKSLTLSKKQVARLLGVRYYGTVSRWENGTVMPSGTNILRMTFLYRMEATQLYPEYYGHVRDCLKEKIQKHRIHLENMKPAHRSTNR